MLIDITLQSQLSELLCDCMNLGFNITYGWKFLITMYYHCDSIPEHASVFKGPSTSSDLHGPEFSLSTGKKLISFQ